MSYAELDDHPRKHTLLSTALTLMTGIEDGKKHIEAQEATKEGLRKK